ncbi:hypothetical protein B0T25DRAFT_569382 [Lasiosphaeria hispida]|uniref:Heterokaryon incompatibility domain-containing protein n=1 Tax=Lasiosphaeria hispida TaxID=260671 RepID=A0AAJ0HDB2_9PEZI|nr:hypothetical protein B0T25DRAFT_569382 [Lasiosphaeria hispida]
MYHSHQATKRHDEVFTELGMSSEESIAPGLLPNFGYSQSQGEARSPAGGSFKPTRLLLVSESPVALAQAAARDSPAPATSQDEKVAPEATTKVYLLARPSDTQGLYFYKAQFSPAFLDRLDMPSRYFPSRAVKISYYLIPLSPTRKLAQAMDYTISVIHGVTRPGGARDLSRPDLPGCHRSHTPLRVDYIWIDCLCIIQDSREDWQKESLVMESVYGNSYCNIATTASADGRGGLFRERDIRAVQPCIVGIGMGGAKQDHYLGDFDSWWRTFERLPLNLLWECNELVACERHPLGLGTPLPAAESPRVFRIGAPRSPNPRLEVYNIWKPIIHAYSSCAITKDTDKLVALHGIAAKVQGVLGCEYVSGLWGLGLESQLAWNVVSPKSSHRPAQHVAPSWSWAAVVGEVDLLPRYDNITETGGDLCRVLEVQKSSGTLPAFISHDELVVRCYLLPITVIPISRDDWTGEIPGGEHYDVFFEREPDVDSEWSWTTAQQRWLMPTWASASSALRGLVLERRPQDGGKFRCCGAFQCSPGEEKSSFWNTCLDFMGSDANLKNLEKRRLHAVLQPVDPDDGSENWGKHEIGNDIDQFVISVL